ncbi:TetR/AcrR family transcriptional regulator [Variovorax sp. PCZ-1]|uniref:TetR/AcrR family transcriptional regulator n=1 Tax=Variovorax sp. PCZ-1 TaxID=2835533 RepID=UPI001BCEB760|nr:TetR/AcrR family transcriptional regulator [Variovorax sp. PCZ-1]MBS7807343.1 TetR/AcrR family transcriptional regulator [Variovorax sp. PCZ-1]
MSESVISPPAAKKGRPLSFDRERALHQAMLLFWRHGYESTSLNDLTTTIGVKPSSIYTVFKDKKSLFLESVELYTSGPVTAQTIINDAPTAFDAAQGLLHASAIGFTGKDTPAGCLLATSAISCSEASSDVQSHLASIRLGIEQQLREKIKQSIKQGHLRKTADASALAAHTMAVIQGLSTLARDGATRAKLLKVSDMAMQAWAVHTSGDASASGSTA